MEYLSYKHFTTRKIEYNKLISGNLWSCGVGWNIFPREFPSYQPCISNDTTYKYDTINNSCNVIVVAFAPSAFRGTREHTLSHSHTPQAH